MHELEFADAALPEPIRCLLLPLAPYCLRHELILLRKRSPFLCLTQIQFDALDRTPQIHALVFAVMVCARRQPWLAALWRRRIRSAD